MSKEQLLKEQLLKEAEAIKEELIEIRRDLHRHPEIGFCEFRTSDIVKTYLKNLGIEVTEIAGTGIVGLLRGAKPGKTMLIRGDMDCLKMEELSKADFKSENPGLMHACGHDVHTTWTLGTAKILSQHRDELKGNVKFVFQPAEELVSGGAKKMIAENKLCYEDVDIAIAGHIEVQPSYSTGRIGIKYGSMFSAADYFKLVITGKGGHAAFPHTCVDPISLGVQVYNGIQHLLGRKNNPMDTAIISVGTMHSGILNNVIPEKLEMEGNIRSLNTEIKNSIEEKFKALVDGIVKGQGGEYELIFERVCPALVNDDECTKFIEKIGGEFYEKENVMVLEKGDMTYEDFAFFLEKVPGAYINIGIYNEEVGSTYGLHNQHLFVDEEVIHNTVAFFSLCALRYLS